MRTIELNPIQFSFPNFCFEKEFKNYMFLESAILANTQEAENYFFEILIFLEGIVTNEETEMKQLVWELLIPYSIQSSWKDSVGNTGSYSIDKEVKMCTLLQLKHFFITNFYEEKQSHFIQLVDQFWIGLTDKVCVYALYDGEIIVIGTDVEYNWDQIKNEKFVNFFYKSFDQYIDHWGPILKYNKHQIDFLKCRFLKIRHNYN